MDIYIIHRNLYVDTSKHIPLFSIQNRISKRMFKRSYKLLAFVDKRRKDQVPVDFMMPYSGESPPLILNGTALPQTGLVCYLWVFLNFWLLLKGRVLHRSTLSTNCTCIQIKESCPQILISI